jgi:hypothetical protein
VVIIFNKKEFNDILLKKLEKELIMTDEKDFINETFYGETLEIIEIEKTIEKSNEISKFNKKKKKIYFVHYY